ncbi:hypothetical protein PpBr36_00746, partial [Pyricularia pennisetigena]|uniref:hypothetical protein n=1 Tax=Pyricularia pennisetigena TaxID=1578925 RepID=UPI001154896D
VPEPDSAPTNLRPLTPGPYLVTTDRRPFFGSFTSRLFRCYKNEPHQSVDHGEDPSPINQASSHRSSHFVKQHAGLLVDTDLCQTAT